MGMSPRKVGKLLIENHMKGGFKDGMGTKKKFLIGETQGFMCKIVGFQNQKSGD
jgi:hypothetical protein